MSARYPTMNAWLNKYFWHDFLSSRFSIEAVKPLVVLNFLHFRLMMLLWSFKIVEKVENLKKKFLNLFFSHSYLMVLWGHCPVAWAHLKLLDRWLYSCLKNILVLPQCLPVFQVPWQQNKPKSPYTACLILGVVIHCLLLAKSGSAWWAHVSTLVTSVQRILINDILGLFVA